MPRRDIVEVGPDDEWKANPKALKSRTSASREIDRESHQIRQRAML
jgi:hypothetical protein